MPCRYKILVVFNLTGQVKSYARLAESRVLDRSMAIVMGPTPPGTGVIKDATLTASS